MKSEQNTISVGFAVRKDIGGWMRLVQRVKNDFPGLETDKALIEHRLAVLSFIDKREAVCAMVLGEIVGVLLFSKEDNILCFLAVEPAHRRHHIAEKMYRFILPHMSADKPITVTTYRDGATEGTAARAFYQKLGFAPGRLTVEFGSEVQEFVLDVKK